MMDFDLLKVVWEDLEYITKEWNDQNINDSNLRRSSTVLRSLLIEGRLITVANLFNTKLRVLSSGTEHASIPGAVTHQAGGAKHKKMKIEGVSTYDRVLSSKEIKESYERGIKRKNKPIKLSLFIKLPSITITDTEINKEEIIKYVCNKLGGAHYDSTRKSPTKNGRVTLEGKYALLDNYQKENKLADKNAVFFELLSIGQKLVNNRDVQKLKRKIKELLKSQNLI